MIALASLGLLLGAMAPAAGENPTERAFLEEYWRRPIPSQGVPPARFVGLERSLAPENCGACHPTQFADWKTTLHARSMGPGVTGQLVTMWPADPDTARLCQSCHAPLAEQHPVTEEGSANAAFDRRLEHDGLTCAACHVRRYQRFGPPRRTGSTAPSAPRAYLAHDGVTRTTAFERAEFCASCHQFGADGFALNGKLLENTYEEWKQSRRAPCQTCHMPDRRHLWRGIHDPDMVKRGVRIAVKTDRPRYRPGTALQATIAIKNVGVGHYFPTYVTPRVVVRAGLVDERGASVPGSAEEYVIAREVSADLSREMFDTRLAPGAAARFSYRRPLASAGLTLRVTVTVYPDHFYTQLFESLLATGAGAGEAEIRDALAASRASSFELFRRDMRLT